MLKISSKESKHCSFFLPKRANTVLISCNKESKHSAHFFYQIDQTLLNFSSKESKHFSFLHLCSFAILSFSIFCFLTWTLKLVWCFLQSFQNYVASILGVIFKQHSNFFNWKTADIVHVNFKNCRIYFKTLFCKTTFYFTKLFLKRTCYLKKQHYLLKINMLF